MLARQQIQEMGQASARSLLDEVASVQILTQILEAAGQQDTVSFEAQHQAEKLRACGLLEYCGTGAWMSGPKGHVLYHYRLTPKGRVVLAAGPTAEDFQP